MAEIISRGGQAVVIELIERLEKYGVIGRDDSRNVIKMLLKMRVDESEPATMELVFRTRIRRVEAKTIDHGKC